MKPRCGRPAILAVDDDATILESYRLVLEPRYECLTATSGAAALEILRSRRVDVVLLDLLMPGMDGLEVLAQMKEVDPRIEVILVSGLAQPPAIVAGMKLGAFEYLTKPFAEDDLLGLIAEAVIRRRADPGTILLIGEDPPLLASFAVVLSPHVIVATSAPRLAMLPDATKRTPLLVIYDCPPTSAGHTDLAERVSERYWRSKLLLLTGQGAVLSHPVPSRGTVMTKPYRFDEALQRIATLVPDLGELSARSAQLGPHLLRLVDFVVQSYREPMGARHLAHAVGCSTGHLAHLVRDRLGLSLKAYLTRFRFEVARHLLIATDLAIDETANRAGFSNASHLSRTFVRYGGYRPGNYRRQVRISGMWPPRLAVQSSLSGVDLAAEEVPAHCSDVSPAVKRARIRQKLRAGQLPRKPPRAVHIDRRPFASRRRSGISVGASCAGCDELIKPGDIMCDYAYPSGDVIGFHESCERIWIEERERDANA